MAMLQLGTGRRLPPRRAEAPHPLVYVYEEGPANSWLSRCTNESLLERNNEPDMRLHHALLRHPWRTREPHQADLFFVPAYLSASYRGGCGDHRANLASTVLTLEESPFFRKSGGKDHIISLFDWRLKPHVLGELGKLAREMIVAHFEVADWPRSFAVPYGNVGVLGREADPEESREFGSRRHSLFFMGQADNRFAYRERRIALRRLPAAFPDAFLVQAGHCRRPCWWEPYLDSPEDPVELHGELPACSESGWGGCRWGRDLPLYLEHGRDSRFHLVIHGDTPSTGRLYDAVHFGAVPIVVSEGFQEEAMPFPHELPWQDYAVFVSQAAFVADPAGAMREAVASADLLARRQQIPQMRAALDWSAAGDCLATAALTHVGRTFLGLEGLPPASRSFLCSPPLVAVSTAAARLGPGSRGAPGRVRSAAPAERAAVSAGVFGED